MQLDPDLFETSPDMTARFEKLGGMIPVVIIDNFYRRPEAVREAALRLSFAPPPYPYPGRLANIHGRNPSLEAVRQTVLRIVNAEYLPKVPIAQGGRRIERFRDVFTDFAVIDVHPDELSDLQRLPHTDPVAVFGLVYLNREERGGTLFFRQTADVGENAGGDGYVTGTTREFELCGRIEPAFNRLAVYPGFVPHTGDISGDWIRGEDRFADPRLTQRFAFTA